MSIQNTIVQMQNNTNRIQYEQGRQNVGSGKIGKDAFMQLLMAQLQHQDPMNPMEDAEFISQQAQFTQIEKLDQLIDTVGANNMIGQASSLVGKQVEVALEGGGTRSGQVDSVQIGTNGVGVTIGDQTYAMSQVVRIFSGGP